MQTQSDYRLLPIFLQSKLAILNPRNRDQKSFGHAIALFYHPSDWRKKSFKQSVETRFIEHGLNQVQYPVLIEEIPALEEQLNLKINVFTFCDQGGFKRHSLYISNKFKPNEINLLYWEGRYAWIKYLSRLFSDARKYVILYFCYI